MITTQPGWAEMQTILFVMKCTVYSSISFFYGIDVDVWPQDAAGDEAAGGAVGRGRSRRRPGHAAATKRNNSVTLQLAFN